MQALYAAHTLSPFANLPQAIAIVGPTASGKSAIALHLAEILGGEIISMDSAQVYRGLDIGTAKPGRDERARIPHHLIDIREPWQPYSAADFAQDAARVLQDIQARGQRALLVGGTLLYLRALTQGLAPMPAADAVIRTRLSQEAASLGWPALHARLHAVDPQAAARIQPLDAQRIQRALEVWELSGRALSSWWQDNPNSAADAAQQGPKLRVLALMPRDRSVLHQRIETRWHTMLAQGFLDEVRRLRALPGMHAGLPSMRAVGYRQAWSYLDTVATTPALEETRYTHFVAQGLAATRQLAKRQLTWLRSMQPDAIVPCDDPQAALTATQAWVRAW